jgi:hypothetical protein
MNARWWAWWVAGLVVLVGAWASPASAATQYLWYFNTCGAGTPCTAAAGVSNPGSLAATCQSTNACNGDAMSNVCVPTSACSTSSCSAVLESFPGYDISCSGIYTNPSTGATSPWSNPAANILTYTTAPGTQSCPASGAVEDIYSNAGATGTVCGSDGCLYSAQTPTYIVNSPPGYHYLQTVTSQGTQCSQSAATVPSSPVVPLSQGTQPQCGAGASGVVECDAQPQAGAGCGSFNGNWVCVSAIPNNSCVSYASGGVACASDALAEPSGPAPNNGTAGVAATATGSVSYNSSTVNYFEASVVAGSSSAPATTAATNGGAPTGVGGSGGGGGSGTVTVSGTVATTDANAAANGDCSAGGCTVGVPSLPDVSGLSYSGEFATFWAAIQAAPIVAGAAALESAWPSGSCAVGTVTLTTLPSTTLDYGTPFCNVWNADVAPTLTTVSLVVWALLGVFILLSA